MHIRASCTNLTCCDDCDVRDLNAEPLIITHNYFEEEKKQQKGTAEI